jgi:hypothetical protein
VNFYPLPISSVKIIAKSGRDGYSGKNGLIGHGGKNGDKFCG